MPEPIKFDLVADIYDVYVTINLDLIFFLDETSSFEEEILELMCGTGRVSIPLLEAGKKLCCVDYSEKMLDVFKNKIVGKNYPVRLIQMDVTKLDLGKEFGLILLPSHSFSEILSSELQFKTLKVITGHLKPGGIFICTLQNPTARLQTVDGKTRQLGEFIFHDNKKMIVSYSNKYDPTSGIVSGFQQYEIYDNHNTIIDKRILDINFKLISDSEFKSFIKYLDLEIIDIYGDYSKNPFSELTSNFLIYKLKKQENLTRGKIYKCQI
jgi:SAM-dependent methyltransferase